MSRSRYTLLINLKRPSYYLLDSLLQEIWVELMPIRYFYMIADEGFSESFNKCWQNIQMNFSFSHTVFVIQMTQKNLTHNHKSQISMTMAPILFRGLKMAKKRVSIAFLSLVGPKCFRPLFQISDIKPKLSPVRLKVSKNGNRCHFHRPLMVGLMVYICVWSV